LTDERRARAERELAAGAPVAVAAQRIGVGRRTLTRWIAEGRVVRRKLASAPDPVPPPEGEQPLSFAERFAKAEPGLVGVIAAAAGRGSWHATAWLLERRWPEPRVPSRGDSWPYLDLGRLGPSVAPVVAAGLGRR
jgi:hypothetical protein